MANGVYCIHCGYCETAHGEEDEGCRREGFRYGLKDCPGYSPSPEEAKSAKIHVESSAHEIPYD